MSGQQRFVTFAEIMAKVGSLVFYWARLESALVSSTASARERLGLPVRQVRGILPVRLDVWRGLITQLPENRNRDATADKVRQQADLLRGARNLIVHGLHGGNGVAEILPPGITCAVGGYDKPTDEVVHFSLDDLEHLIQGIDACARAFWRLENFNYAVEPADLPQPQKRTVAKRKRKPA